MWNRALSDLQLALRACMCAPNKRSISIRRRVESQYLRCLASNKNDAVQNMHDFPRARMCVLINMLQYVKEIVCKVRDA